MCVCVCVTEKASFLYFSLPLLLFSGLVSEFASEFWAGVTALTRRFSRSATGHRVQDPNPRLPESLSGFEMGEVIEAKPLIAISL